MPCPRADLYTALRPYASAEQLRVIEAIEQHDSMKQAALSLRMTTANLAGLLRILRVYTALVFGLAVLVLWNVRQEADPTNPRFPETTVWFFGLALLLISWKAMRPRMGRWYLPAILTLITLGPIISSAVTIAGRLDAGMTPNESLADYWQPFFLLWVPLLMVAWQYRYRAAAGAVRG